MTFKALSLADVVTNIIKSIISGAMLFIAYIIAELAFVMSYTMATKTLVSGVYSYTYAVVPFTFSWLTIVIIIALISVGFIYSAFTMWK